MSEGGGKVVVGWSMHVHSAPKIDMPRPLLTLKYQYLAKMDNGIYSTRLKGKVHHTTA